MGSIRKIYSRLCYWENKRIFLQLFLGVLYGFLSSWKFTRSSSNQVIWSNCLLSNNGLLFNIFILVIFVSKRPNHFLWKPLRWFVIVASVKYCIEITKLQYNGSITLSDGGLIVKLSYWRKSLRIQIGKNISKIYSQNA